MRTTVDIPDGIYRQLKIPGGTRGQLHEGAHPAWRQEGPERNAATVALDNVAIYNIAFP